MGFLGWIILGGLAGWAAHGLLGEEHQGCLVNILVGIVGGVLGGAVFSALGGAGVTGFNIWSFGVAVVGAIILLGILRLVWGGDRRGRRPRR